MEQVITQLAVKILFDDYSGFYDMRRTIFFFFFFTGPRSAVGTVSGYRCVSDCRSRGPESDPGPVPYFRGD